MRTIAIATPSLGEEEWQALREPLFSGWLTQGPKVQAFEKAFADYHQVPHALAVTSCTTGLHLALKALNIGPGDEVIVPAFTWVATANVVLHCGATPVFCDVDRETFNLDISAVSSKITERTKAVIPVHLFGLCSDIDSLKNILPPHVKILEDAACAAGAFYKGRAAGSLGDIAAFSFHPRKSITTGEGGMVTTSTQELAGCVEILRSHGASISEEKRHQSPKPYILPEFSVPGFNYRMTDLQAAVGCVQLTKLSGFIQERQKLVDDYKEKLSHLEWLKPQRLPEYCTQHAWQSFVCSVDPHKAPLSRNDMMDMLQQKGIATRPGTHAVHMLAFYQKTFSLKPEDFPAARDCDNFTIALPLHNQLTEEDIDYVVQALSSF